MGTASNRQKKMNDDQYMTPTELAVRWRDRVNIRTLANWRSSGQGPKFVKIGGRVLYLLKFIEEYEVKRVRGAR